MEKKTPLLDEIGRKHRYESARQLFCRFHRKDDGKFAGKGNFPNSCNLRYGFG